MRRDQQPASKYFSGSGFPLPSKGSRRTASIKSKTRSAMRLSVSIQERRSSRNWGRKTDSSFNAILRDPSRHAAYRQIEAFFCHVLSSAKPLGAVQRSSENAASGQFPVARKA